MHVSMRGVATACGRVRPCVRGGRSGVGGMWQVEGRSSDVWCVVCVCVCEYEYECECACVTQNMTTCATQT